MGGWRALFDEDVFGWRARRSRVQRESNGSYHFKSTLVQQAASSHYSFVEARVKGGLSRHDLGIQQDGPEVSVTQLSHPGASFPYTLTTRKVLDLSPREGA